MYRPRINYWSSSPFAKWLREKAGLTNPTALSLDGWAEHKKECVEKAPFTFWLTKSFFNKAQDFFYYPADVLYSVKRFYKNWKGNTHVLDGGLKVGQWHDLSYRILPCLFGELIKYIEEEKGLDTLEWEKGLVYDESWMLAEDDERLGQPTSQALAAIEQEKLYKWYKEVYLKRPDPMDASGLTEYYERKDDGDIFCKPKEGDGWKEMNAKCTEIEQQYLLEEEEMLIRLIKIRNSLWS